MGWDRAVSHLVMLENSRTETYRKAILEVVKKGDVVADVGTGTGILAFFACQAGAKRVYAIEQTEVIESAREIGKANGLEDRIVFINKLSTETELPEKVDVIVSDIMEPFCLEGGLLDFTIDARERFLKPGGRMIPYHVKMFIVPVQSEEIYSRVHFWNEDVYGVDYRLVRDRAVNTSYIHLLQPQDYLSEPAALNEIDLHQAKDNLMDGAVKFRIGRKGILHGIGGWFEAKLSENVLLSTSPETPCPLRKYRFFPIGKPLEVSEGDTLEVRIGAGQGCGLGFVWNWNLKLSRSRGGEIRFAHSSFDPSRSDLLLRMSHFTPSLSETGAIDLFILSQCNGNSTILQIAEQLCQHYPSLFDNVKKARNKVSGTLKGKVSVKGKLSEYDKKE
jgi:protein arginine N-methyltransferase 1